MTVLCPKPFHLEDKYGTTRSIVVIRCFYGDRIEQNKGKKGVKERKNEEGGERWTYKIISVEFQRNFALVPDGSE
jgi:hypothetical protein